MIMEKTGSPFSFFLLELFDQWGSVVLFNLIIAYIYEFGLLSFKWVHDVEFWIWQISLVENLLGFSFHDAIFSYLFEGALFPQIGRAHV